MLLDVSDWDIITTTPSTGISLDTTGSTFDCGGEELIGLRFAQQQQQQQSATTGRRKRNNNKKNKKKNSSLVLDRDDAYYDDDAEIVLTSDRQIRVLFKGGGSGFCGSQNKNKNKKRKISTTTTTTSLSSSQQQENDDDDDMEEDRTLSYDIRNDSPSIDDDDDDDHDKEEAKKKKEQEEEGGVGGGRTIASGSGTMTTMTTKTKIPAILDVMNHRMYAIVDDGENLRLSSWDATTTTTSQPMNIIIDENDNCCNKNKNKNTCFASSCTLRSPALSMSLLQVQNDDDDEKNIDNNRNNNKDDTTRTTTVTQSLIYGTCEDRSVFIARLDKNRSNNNRLLIKYYVITHDDDDDDNNNNNTTEKNDDDILKHHIGTYASVISNNKMKVSNHDNNNSSNKNGSTNDDGGGGVVMITIFQIFTDMLRHVYLVRRNIQYNYNLCSSSSNDVDDNEPLLHIDKNDGCSSSSCMMSRIPLIRNKNDKNNHNNNSTTKVLSTTIVGETTTTTTTRRRLDRVHVLGYVDEPTRTVTIGFTITNTNKNTSIIMTKNDHNQHPSNSSLTLTKEQQKTEAAASTTTNHSSSSEYWWSTISFETGKIIGIPMQFPYGTQFAGLVGPNLLAVVVVVGGGEYRRQQKNNDHYQIMLLDTNRGGYVHANLDLPSTLSRASTSHNNDDDDNDDDDSNRFMMLTDPKRGKLAIVSSFHNNNNDKTQTKKMTTSLLCRVAMIKIRMMKSKKMRRLQRQQQQQQHGIWSATSSSSSLASQIAVSLEVSAHSNSSPSRLVDIGVAVKTTPAIQSAIDSLKRAFEKHNYNITGNGMAGSLLSLLKVYDTVLDGLLSSSCSQSSSLSCQHNNNNLIHRHRNDNQEKPITASPPQPPLELNQEQRLNGDDGDSSNMIIDSNDKNSEAKDPERDEEEEVQRMQLPKPGGGGVTAAPREQIVAITPRRTPQAFVDVATTLIIRHLLLGRQQQQQQQQQGRDQDDKDSRRREPDDASLILRSLIQSGKVMARRHLQQKMKTMSSDQFSDEANVAAVSQSAFSCLLFSLESKRREDCNVDNEDGVLDNWDPSQHGGRGVGKCCFYYSPVEFIFDVLNHCPDVSERLMTIALSYVISRAKPYDMAMCFLSQQPNDDVDDSYAKAMAEKYMQQLAMMATEHGQNDDNNEDDVVSLSTMTMKKMKADLHRISTRLIARCCSMLVTAIVSYSSINESLLRASLMENMTRPELIMLGRLFANAFKHTQGGHRRALRQRGYSSGEVDGTLSSSRNVLTRIVQWLSVLLDCLTQRRGSDVQTGNDDIEAEEIERIRTIIQAEVEKTEAIISLQRLLLHSGLDMQTHKDIDVDDDDDDDVGAMMEPYSVERIIF